MSKRKRKQQKRVFPQVTGKVQMTREGFAFVVSEDSEDDVFVKASKTRGALNGDIVRVSVTREKTDRQRREGEIIEIVERSAKPFIGILHVVGNQAWVLMESRFMPYDISIPIAQSDAVRYRRHKGKDEPQRDETGWLRPKDGDVFSVCNVYEMLEEGGRRELPVRSGMKVAAVVDDWPRHESNPRGHLVDVLGEPGENDTEMHAILAEYALPYRFESAVANAADVIPEEITAEDIAGRRDFRDVLTFTIDPADAKDFDDAISFRRLEDGNYEVGVHIADVTHYVRPGSVVDDEAKSRGTSVYLVDRTVPMLPEKLSNKLCSLRPNEEKLTFSAVFVITPLARIVSQWFGRTVIRSDYRFAYEDAQQVIEAGNKALDMDMKGGTDGIAQDTLIPREQKEAVLIMNSLASKLRRKRFASGAISFERPEMKVIVDEKGRPVDVCQKVSKEANWLIEEFMLLANRSVAEFVATGCKGVGETPARGRKQIKTFVYRVHDEPNQEKLENLKNFIGNFGYKLGPTNNGKEISKELNSLFEKAKDTPEYNAIELLSLRTMAKARYDTENLGHYGLAFKYYTHFTSPIRRYPDMMVHRLLARYLEGGESARQETFDKLCKHSTEREIIAAEAERASIKYKLVEFMQDKVGYEFEGHISGLTEWGMYVEVEPTKIEGMVPLRDIKSDFFEFDQEHYRLVGRRSRIVYNLGDPVRIRVKKTNLEQKLLDYELVETGSEDRIYDRIDYEHGRGTSFVKGADGDFDNVTVGINKAARKEKIRKAIQESKKKSRKSSGRKPRKLEQK
ncbi:MAG: ribonuclease R [Bacteroidales bacterium]|nr:ribonuclease R [Bacteroidales bacterium]